jgi:hypothetical protein
MSVVIWAEDELPAMKAETWNLFHLDHRISREVMERLEEWWAEEGSRLPVYPRARRVESEDLDSIFESAAENTDLCLALLPGGSLIRPEPVLVLAHPKRSLIEVSTLTTDMLSAEVSLDEVLRVNEERFVPYWGLDLAAKREGAPIVGFVRPDSPAATAGIHAGDELITVNGIELNGPDALAVVMPQLRGVDPVACSVRGANRAKRTISLTPKLNLAAPNPASLVDDLILPGIVRAESDKMNAERTEDKVSASVTLGLLLAAAGRPEEAVKVLGASGIDPRLDSSGDARGTTL